MPNVCGGVSTREHVMRLSSARKDLTAFTYATNMQNRKAVHKITSWFPGLGHFARVGNSVVITKSCFCMKMHSKFPTHNSQVVKCTVMDSIR